VRTTGKNSRAPYCLATGVLVDAVWILWKHHPIQLHLLRMSGKPMPFIIIRTLQQFNIQSSIATGVRFYRHMFICSDITSTARKKPSAVPILLPSKPIGKCFRGHEVKQIDFRNRKFETCFKSCTPCTTKAMKASLQSSTTSPLLRIPSETCLIAAG
jgi:hypothetical protein